MGVNLPGQSLRLCGHPIQVASCGSHSAGRRYPSAAGEVLRTLAHDWFRPSPPWGRGWTAPAFSSAGAGRVRGPQAYGSGVTTCPSQAGAMLVAIKPRISYTARLQANCNPALSRTRKLVTPNVIWAHSATDD